MKRKNWLLYLCIIILTIISILDLYNAKYLDYSYKNYYIKQIIWVIIGWIVFLLTKRIKISKFFHLSFFLYTGSILLLLIVLLFGKSINGAKAWLNFGFISIQPSEIMRLALPIFLIQLTSNWNFKKNNEFIYIITIGIITLIPSILVFLEPDTGAIIFYLIILFGIIWQAPISKKWFFILIGIIALMLSAFLYLFFHQQDYLIKIIGTSFFYRMDRLINFKNNVGYQIENALITIASTSWLGTGLGKVLIYIPEAPTDFIFAFSIGNFGLLSGVIIILCYLFIDFELIKKSKRVKHKKTSQLFNTFLLMFLFQQFYNLMMNVNLLPIMGIPLPFLSYGGTTMILYFTFLGLIV